MHSSYDELEVSGIFSALERSVTLSEPLSRQAETTQGQQTRGWLERSASPNLFVSPMSGSVSDDAFASFDEQGTPDVNAFPQNQGDEKQWASRTPDSRRECGDVDASGTMGNYDGSAHADGAARGFPPLAEGGNAGTASLGGGTSGTVSARGAGRATFSPAKSLLSRLSRRPSAITITGALRYQQLESPRKEEAGGRSEQDLTFATGNAIGRGAVNVHKNIRDKFGSPCVEPGVASSRGYPDLAPPRRDAMEGKINIVRGGEEERVVSEGQGVRYGDANRMRISSSTVSSWASSPKMLTPVCNEQGWQPSPSAAPAELMGAESSEVRVVMETGDGSNCVEVFTGDQTKPFVYRFYLCPSCCEEGTRSKASPCVSPPRPAPAPSTSHSSRL